MALSTNVDYNEKIKSLQELQHDSEQRRKQHSQQLKTYHKSDQRLQKLEAAKLQSYWKKICEDDRKSRSFNEQLLKEFDRVETNMANLGAKTERLRLKKKQYEDYIERLYPRWRQRVLQKLEDDKAREQQNAASETAPLQLYAASMQHAPHFSNNPTQSHSPTNPTQSHFSNNPTQSHFPTNPTQSQFSNNPTQSQFSTNPTQLQFSTNPTQSQFSTNPTQSQFHNNPTQSQFHNNSTQSHAGYNPEPAAQDVGPPMGPHHSHPSHNMPKSYMPDTWNGYQNEPHNMRPVAQSHNSDPQIHGHDMSYQGRFDTPGTVMSPSNKPANADAPAVNLRDYGHVRENVNTRTAPLQEPQVATLGGGFTQQTSTPDPASHQMLSSGQPDNFNRQKAHSVSFANEPNVPVAMLQHESPGRQENLHNEGIDNRYRGLEYPDQSVARDVGDGTKQIVSPTSRSPTHAPHKGLDSELSPHPQRLNNQDNGHPESVRQGHLDAHKNILQVVSPRNDAMEGQGITAVGDDVESDLNLSLSDSKSPSHSMSPRSPKLPVNEDRMKESPTSPALSPRSDNPVSTDGEADRALVSPPVIVSESGFIALLEAAENGLASASNRQKYYKTDLPSSSTSLDIIRSANTGQTIDHLDAPVVSMVILDQLPLIVKDLEDGCLPDTTLKLANSFKTEEELRTKIPASAMNLWTHLYDHWKSLVKHDAMSSRDIARLFAPLLVNPHSREIEKAISLIESILEVPSGGEAEESESESDFSDPPLSPDEKKRSVVPPLELESPVHKQDSDDDFFNAKSPANDVDLSQTAAYRSLLGGTTNQVKPRTYSDSDSDSLDDIEKKMSSVVSPHRRQDSHRSQSSGKLSVRSEAMSPDITSEISAASSPGYVPSGMSRGGSVKGAASMATTSKSASGKKPAAFRTGSDIETDSDFDLAVSAGAGQQSDEGDDDFDFYG